MADDEITKRGGPPPPWGEDTTSIRLRIVEARRRVASIAGDVREHAETLGAHAAELKALGTELARIDERLRGVQRTLYWAVGAIGAIVTTGFGVVITMLGGHK